MSDVVRTGCPAAETGAVTGAALEKRRALKIGMPYLAMVLDSPDRSPEHVRRLGEEMDRAGVPQKIARVITRDVLIGAMLHAPTLHPLYRPVKVSATTRPSTGWPFYVDDYYFTRPLPEPLNSAFVALADGGLFVALQRYSALFSDTAAVRDPLLTTAIDAQDQLPLMPWEAEARMTPRQRLRKLLVGSIVDDVFSAVALVVGAEQTLADEELGRARRTILEGMASLRLPALLDRENLVRIWRLRTPFHTEDGVMSGIPVVERTGSRFHYPEATSGTSLCVGMYTITRLKSAFDEMGGYPVFRSLMGPNVKEVDEEMVKYRLADVDLANVCAFAEPLWLKGERLAPEGTFEPPERPVSPDESDRWPSLF